MREALKIKDIELLKDFVDGDLYARLLASRHSCLALEEGSFLILFHFCNIKDPSHREEKVCIYCSSKDFIFLSNNAHCKKILGEMNDQIDNFTLLLHFFQNLIANDVYDLEKIEDGITSLEDNLLTDKEIQSSRTTQIIGLRRELLKMKRYYEQLSLVTHELTENANNAINKDMLKKFFSVDRRIGYLLNSVLHLREYVTQVREAYQAQIDIEQNQIMRVFTVITAVFLPLTLIVGWYGMNLQMPEYTWRFGYFVVILLSIAVSVGSILFFKRKKWF